MHWITRACFLLAVVSGCLSVYYACALQRIIGELYKADLVKDWLRMPALDELGGGGSEHDVQGTSLAAVFIISAPFNMVRVSIFTFVLGLVIYQGFVFTKRLDTSAAPGDSRSNFIVIIVGTGLCLAFFTFSFSAKDMESTLMKDPVRRGRPNHPQEAQAQSQPGNIGDIGTITETENNTGTMQEDQSTHAQHSGAQDHSDSLAMALEAAARAHVQCAEADRRVALAYTRLSGVA